MGHTHPVTDMDVYFEIDAVTRKIQAKSGKSALIQGDHNSEVFTFRLPRLIDGHDMSKCNSVQVHYINVDSTTKAQINGVYAVEDMRVDPEDENAVVLSWLISQNATKYAGILSFIVKFMCVDGGAVSYVWNTAIFTGISISNGIDNSGVIVEEYADVLAQWEVRLDTLEQGGASDEQIGQAVADYLKDNPVQTGGDSSLLVVTFTTDESGKHTPSHTYAQIKEWVDNGGSAVLTDGKVWYNLATVSASIIRFERTVIAASGALYVCYVIPTIGEMTKAESVNDGVAVKTVNGVAPDENGNVDTTKPTNEQVASAVVAYLNAHPEATTTVQDKSITEAKLSESVIKRIDGNAIFAGKTASFYGDSLTAVNDHYTKGYHSWLKDLLGLASYKNYGVSGYKVSDVYNKVNSVTDTADVIFVMCGVNDQTFSVPLGTVGDATSNTTYGALNLLCSLLKRKYPTSIVVFITPSYQTKYLHKNGVTSYEVSKAIREVCEKYAIPVYDNFVLSGIYSTNLSVFTTDNCHWNDTAHEMVGKNLAKFVCDTFRYIYGNTSGGGGDSGEDTTVSVTGVTLNATSGTIADGESVTLTATVLPTDATNKNVLWESNNTGVATVSGGVVQAVSVGNATITATTVDGGFTATYLLTVESAEGGNGGQIVYPTKTAEVTGYKTANEWHVSLYVTAEDLPSIDNETVTYGFVMKPISDFEVTSRNSTGGIYIVDKVNDLAAGFTSAVTSTLGHPTITDNQDGTYAVTISRVVNKSANKDYWLFPINLKLAVGDKFALSDAYVKVGEQYYQICDIGGAFKEETCTFE